ncbi:MAG: PAS domain S-box protein [Pyrinomonadaceae bacterium]|nr:PAS domain S-box protein [Sphingobacteriaceae bacterium]
MFSDPNLLKQVLDTIDEGVLVTNSDGVIVGFNHQIISILELGGDEVIEILAGKNKCTYVHENGAPLSIEQLPSSITRSTKQPVKNRIIGVSIVDKPIKWVRVNTQILEYQTEWYVFVAFTDITQEHSLKQEVIVAKERLNNALKGSDLGVWDYDAENRELYFSEDWKRILGYTPSEIDHAFEQWEKLIYEEDRPVVLKKVTDYLKGKIPEFKIEYRLLSKDGSYKWIYSTGKIITRTNEGAPKRFSGTIKDITAKKKIEDLLRTKEEQFSSAFSYSAIGMALTSLKGKWIDVNPALCDIVGYTKDEMLKLTFQELTYPDDLPADMDNVKRILNKEISTYNMEKRYFHKDGSIVWALLTVSLVNNKAGKPEFFIAQILDITPTKTLITELEAKNTQLKLTTLDLKNKVEQLEEFNRIVAHNLRGPVGNIIQLGDMLAEDKTSADLYISMLKEASHSLDSTLKELIKILEIKLNTAVEQQKCSFTDIVSKVLTMLNIQIQSNEVEIKTNFDIEELEYPAIYLESILYNLISNAVKYRRTTILSEVRISTYKVQDKIVLEVADNGMGIDLKKYGHQIFKLNKIFHKGFDSKGLGLFIVKNQIETMGGTISVESLPDNGSTFKIIF